MRDWHRKLISFLTAAGIIVMTAVGVLGLSGCSRIVHTQPNVTVSEECMTIDDEKTVVRESEQTSEIITRQTNADISSAEIPKSVPKQNIEPETVVQIEYVPQIQYVPQTEYVTEYVYPETPIGYLKERVAENGVLGTDYMILSGYGPRNDYGGQISSFHRGMDFDMPEWTPLIAPDDCIVSYVGYSDIRGYWVVMYWGHGYYIEYQHLNEICAEQGTLLKAGDLVGYSGNTGASMMPHLHLEIMQSYDGTDSLYDFEDNNTRINPYYFVFGEENVNFAEIW